MKNPTCGICGLPSDLCVCSETKKEESRKPTRKCQVENCQNMGRFIHVEIDAENSTGEAKMTEENLTFLKGQIGILTNAIFDYDNCRSYCSSCILCERDEVNEELIFHCSSDAKLLDFFRRILSNELTQSLCENSMQTEKTNL